MLPRPPRSTLFPYTMLFRSALLTAIYMTRMMIYTFHGPNRTGETERSHLAEAPWVMTLPLVVLGVLSAIGGWLNIPEVMRFLGDRKSTRLNSSHGYISYAVF